MRGQNLILRHPGWKTQDHHLVREERVWARQLCRSPRGHLLPRRALPGAGRVCRTGLKPAQAAQAYIRRQCRNKAGSDESSPRPSWSGRPQRRRTADRGGEARPEQTGRNSGTAGADSGRSVGPRRDRPSADWSGTAGHRVARQHPDAWQAPGPAGERRAAHSDPQSDGPSPTYAAADSGRRKGPDRGPTIRGNYQPGRPGHRELDSFAGRARQVCGIPGSIAICIHSPAAAPGAVDQQPGGQAANSSG